MCSGNSGWLYWNTLNSSLQVFCSRFLLVLCFCVFGHEWLYLKRNFIFCYFLTHFRSTTWGKFSGFVNCGGCPCQAWAGGLCEERPGLPGAAHCRLQPPQRRAQPSPTVRAMAPRGTRVCGRAKGRPAGRANSASPASARVGAGGGQEGLRAPGQRPPSSPWRGHGGAGVCVGACAGPCAGAVPWGSWGWRGARAGAVPEGPPALGRAHARAVSLRCHCVATLTPWNLHGVLRWSSLPWLRHCSHRKAPIASGNRQGKSLSNLWGVSFN